MVSINDIEEYHFDIHASVVFQLGESLITDEIQALMELVKNCYDANSTRARVVVDTINAPPPDSAFPTAKGYISIDDDGDGMDVAQIKRGWLTISNSLKRELKRKSLPEGKRTPLGDKGLGRLGAQRLGYNIEIWTRPSGQDVEYHVSFSWRQFAEKQSIFDVLATVTKTAPALRKTGTKIIISDLRNSEYWLGATESIQTNLSQMLSPFGEVQNFKVALQVNGKSLDLVRLAQEVRQTAELHYEAEFDGSILSVAGRARLNFFRPEKKEDQAVWPELAEQDSGAKLLAYLLTQNSIKDFGLAPSTVPGWFIDFGFSRDIRSFSELELIDGHIANPGPFRGEIDSFDLGNESAGRQNVFNKAAEYKQFVTRLSGIRVYRDGFGVRVDQDWLRLGSQWTSARSYYGLKPQNVMGYIALSARYNAALEETTDREGFVNNAYYRNFYEMLGQWVNFTSRAQTVLRRAWNSYSSNSLQKSSGIPDKSPEELSRSLSENLALAQQSIQPLANLATKIEKTVQDARRTVVATEQASIFSMDPIEKSHIEQSVSSFEQSAEEAQSVIAQVGDVVANLSYQETLGRVIGRQVGALREQLAEVYETVGLGLTAEALSHEVHHVADDLAAQTRHIRQVLQRRKVVIAELVTYLERVDTSVAVLVKQLTHLTPSLKYLREKREVISVPAFLVEQKEFFATRFANRGIQVLINQSDNADFLVKTNKGKLVQVIDNLFLNSEYWLQEDIRTGGSDKHITVDIVCPHVRISDDGQGISPDVENTLFEAFVTTKGKGKGRGLGLFIVQQLLDSEGCTITLLPERNAAGHLYMFELNFSTILTTSKNNKS